jgi:hypothetical protein
MEMMMSEALRLAGRLRDDGIDFEAAAELRRLHEANQAMLEALKEIMSWEENDEMTWGPKARAAIAKGEAK